jgi:hypothetical protein
MLSVPSPACAVTESNVAIIAVAAIFILSSAFTPEAQTGRKSRKRSGRFLGEKPTGDIISSGRI